MPAELQGDTFEPSLESFGAKYAAGQPQVVWTRLIDDLETPVSAYLKIARGRPYAFTSRRHRQSSG